ncbi:MAG: hypothetical protein Q8934_03545 [Bacillota bacterium]|nr:hypothetical protein [Bacillota bacterium]
MRKYKRYLFFAILLLGILLAFSYTSLFENHNDTTSTKKGINSKVMKEGSTFKEKPNYHLTNALSNDNKVVKIVKKLLNHNVELRKFPFPYKSMLALCSDIDGTTLTEFLDYHRFLNSNAKTEYGTGLGLDVGDTFWMYVGDDDKGDFDFKNAKVKDEMSYWVGLNTNQLHNNKEIIKFIRNGWIDCIHTYGDFTMQEKNIVTFNKKYAALAINELKKQNIYIKVWLDHGSPSNVQNFVSSNVYRFQKGDNPKSPYYHTNLLIPYGIKFGWGPTSSKFGYNSMIFPRRLKDGNKLWEFYRYSDSVNGKLIWDPEFIDTELSKQNLQSLINHHQYTIVAQHLGIRHNKIIFNQNAINALRYLDEQYLNHNILVARTSRLLNYNLVQQYLNYKATVNNNKMVINILSVNDPLLGKFIPTINDLRGVTFYVDSPQQTQVLVNGKPIDLSYISYNPSDSTGRQSISIKWFDKDLTDYTKF